MSRRLPIVALNTVVFPGGILPLRFFEPRYLDMVKRAIADDEGFGICAIRRGQETGTPAEPFDLGTEVVVTDWSMPEPGILHVRTQARERFIVRTLATAPGGLLVGSVDDLHAECPAPIPETLALAPEILRHIIADVGPERFPAPHALDDAAWVGFRLAEVLPLKLTARQDLLEMNDSVARLKILCEFLRKEIH